MLPETFWGRIQYLLQQYGASFLSGAGNTMIIAIVGTFLGCLIGFIVGIIQTIPVDKRDSAVKKTLVGFLKFYYGMLRGIFPRHPNDGTGHVYLLRKCLPVQYQHVHVVCGIFRSIYQYRSLHGRNRPRRNPFC